MGVIHGASSYVCDNCGRASAHPMMKIRVGTGVYDNSENYDPDRERWEKSYIEADLCENCTENLRSALSHLALPVNPNERK